MYKKNVYNNNAGLNVLFECITIGNKYMKIS